MSAQDSNKSNITQIRDTDFEIIRGALRQVPSFRYPEVALEADTWIEQDDNMVNK